MEYFIGLAVSAFFIAAVSISVWFFLEVSQKTETIDE
jgi:hypothetical protein